MLNPFRKISTLGTSEYAWVGKVAVGIAALLPTYFCWEWVDTQRKVREYQRAVGDKVFMDIGIGNKYAGRILIGLYSERVPLTCENFLQLCKGYRIRDKMIGYQNTVFHLIKPGAALVGGDVLTGTGKTHGMSIYGESFPDENFDMEFLRDGDLAMVNWGKNTNSSIFMITLSSQRALYGHHVVFGTVLKGMKLVREMGELGTRVGRPAMQIRILQCGVVEEGSEEPGPPVGFLPPQGPLMTEDEFRAANVEKPGTQQPS
jgi:peptidylprolyl isomerase